MERYFPIDTDAIQDNTVITVRNVGKTHCLFDVTGKVKKSSNVMEFFLKHIYIYDSRITVKYPLYIFFKLYWKIIIKNIITPILQDLSNVLSNVLHHNHSVILNYSCIKAKVSFQRFLPTLESFQYIGKHWKIPSDH